MRLIKSSTLLPYFVKIADAVSKFLYTKHVLRVCSLLQPLGSPGPLQQFKQSTILLRAKFQLQLQLWWVLFVPGYYEPCLHDTFAQGPDASHNDPTRIFGGTAVVMDGCERFTKDQPPHQQKGAFFVPQSDFDLLAGQIVGMAPRWIQANGWCQKVVKFRSPTGHLVRSSGICPREGPTRTGVIVTAPSKECMVLVAHCSVDCDRQVHSCVELSPSVNGAHVLLLFSKVRLQNHFQGLQLHMAQWHWCFCDPWEFHRGCHLCPRTFGCKMI